MVPPTYLMIGKYGFDLKLDRKKLLIFDFHQTKLMMSSIFLMTSSKLKK